MNKLIGTIILLVFVCAASGFAAPVILSVTGDRNHGGAAIITSTANNFGSKSPALPVFYSDFEEGSNGVTITTGMSATIGDYATEAQYGSEVLPTYSNTRTLANSSMSGRSNFVDGTGRSRLMAFLGGEDELYIDVWRNYDEVSPDPFQIKATRIYTTSGLYPNLTEGWWCRVNGKDDGPVWETICGALDYERRGEGSTRPLQETWTHMQMYVKMGDPDVANGKIHYWKNGVRTVNDNSIINSETCDSGYANYGNMDRVSFGMSYIPRDESGVGCVAASFGAYIYYDNMYVDKTPARVEIGNNSNYESCTHREIQIPTSWSGSSIGVTINAGSFPAESTVYMFVVDANGTPSAGRAFQLGDTGGTTIAAPASIDLTAGVEQITVDWAEVVDANLDHYLVLRDDDADGNYDNVSGSGVASGTETFVNSNLNAGQLYRYAVVAVHTDGTPSAYSPTASETPTGGTVYITEPDSLRLSPMLELDLPIYGSWFNRLYDYPDAEDALTSAYYDSLAQVDVSILPVASFADDRYAGLVDSVRVYNPDWIAIWHQNTNSILQETSESGEGTFYQDRYDMINAGSTADGSYAKSLRIWAGANPDADWWARDINGNRVPVYSADSENYAVQFGAEGLVDAIAMLGIKHIKAQDNLAEFVGVLTDNQEPELENWIFDAETKLIMDLDRNGYGDGTDQNGDSVADTAAAAALLRSHVLALPDAYRRASGRDDFLVTGNGQAAHDSNYAWLWDGCTFEQNEIKNYYPRTNAGTDDIFRLFSRQSTFYSNAVVNPPLLMFLSYVDSCMLTNEVAATIANGVAVFSWRDEGRAGWLDKGIGPLMDLTRPADDNHLELGTRVPGSVTFSNWGTETIYVRNTWTAMTVSNATPILTSSLIVEVNTTANILADDQVYFEDVGGMTQINDNAYTVDTVIDATNFSIAIDASAFDAYTSGGSVSEVTSSYDTDVGRVTAEFYDGANTSYVTVDGFNKHHYPWPYLIVTGTDTISYGSVGIWEDE